MTMQITLFYEDKNHPTILEVPDEECRLWVEADFKRRLDAAEDKSAVTERTAQEILDEEVNKPTFNNNHTETRRHVLLSALDPKEKAVVGDADVQTALLDEDFSELYSAIEKLRPQQKALLCDIFWDEMRQVDIAKRDGVNRAAVAGRLNRILERLKKFLPNPKNFS